MGDYICDQFSDQLTLFSSNESTLTGTFGSGKEGDLKSIHIRYAFPELSGMEYEYKVDE